jgi:signal transduction histidine kinase
MRIMPKVMGVVGIAFLVPIVILGYVAFTSMSRISARAASESADALIAVQREKLQTLTGEKAAFIDAFFRGCADDVHLLAAYYRHVDTHYHAFRTEALGNLYPDKPHPGLPGYGYVHPHYGVYADFDHRGPGCPWMPRRLIGRLAADPALYTNVAAEAHKAMLLTPLFTAVAAKHKGTLDLVWIVLENGLTNVYPPYDYNDLIAKDPGIVDLNENDEDYVRLLDPQRNPTRTTLWLEPYLDPFKGIWMTSCVTPLYAADTFIGTLGMDILLPTVTDMVLSLGLGRDGYAFLVSSSGKVIAVPERGIDDLLWDEAHKRAIRETARLPAEQHWDAAMTNALATRSLNQTPSPELKPVLAAMQAGRRGFQPVTLSGQKKLLAFAPISSAGWSLGMVVPLAEIAAPARGVKATIDQASTSIVQQFLLLALAIVVVSIGAGAYLDYRIVRPLAVLSRDVARVDWDHLALPHAQPATGDEVALLRASFSEMIAALATAKAELTRKTEELRALNETLEQRVRERTAALETANRELDAFSYTVSHDLRAPLRAIESFSQMVYADNRDRLGAEAQDLCRRIVANTQQMKQIIDSLLTFARLGRQELHCTEIDMTDLARMVFEELRLAAPGRAVTFTLKPLPAIRGDAAVLRQVWVNLLQNALKFTRPRAQAEIRVDGWRDGREIVYRVKDNGVGFDPQFAGRLFGVFQRLHAQAEFEGTGAGLAIVKRIVERHGGRVWAESRIDEGAAFYMAFPAPPAEPPDG